MNVKGVIHRSAPLAQVKHRAERAADILLGSPYRFIQRESLGQIGRDGAGERAASAVGIGIVNALALEPLPVVRRLQIVIGIIDLMPALDQHAA